MVGLMQISSTSDRSRRSDPLRIAAFAYVIISLSRIHQHIGFIELLRPALLVLVFMVGWILLKPSSIRTQNLWTSWEPKAVMGLAVLALISGIFGLSIPATAAFFLNIFSRVLVFFFILVVAIRFTSDLRILGWAIVTSMAILLWMGFFVFDMAAAQPGQLQRLQATYMFDSNDLSVILLIGWPLAVAFAFSARKWLKALPLLVIVLTPALIALTGSRGGFLGLTMTVIGLMLVSRHVSALGRGSLAIVGLIAMLLAAPPGYWQQMESIISPGDDYNVTDDSGRIQIWTRGVGYFLEYPLFGVGAGNFTRAEFTLSPLAEGRLAVESFPVHAPHNTFLQVLVEMGIFAFLIWIGLFVAGTVGLHLLSRRIPEAWRKGDSDERFLYFLGMYLPVSFLGFGAAAFFVSHAYLAGFYILVALMVGFKVVLGDRRHELKPRRGQRRHSPRGPRPAVARGAPAPEAVDATRPPPDVAFGARFPRRGPDRGRSDADADASDG